MSVPTSDPLRPVTDDEVDAFARDGVVHLPAILPTDWLDLLVDPVEATIADPAVTTDMTALRTAVTGVSPDSAGTGRFLSGVDHWLHDPVFAAFATASPLPAIAAALMDADRIHLYEDSVLVKEPGTAEAHTVRASSTVPTGSCPTNLSPAPLAHRSRPLPMTTPAWCASPSNRATSSSTTPPPSTVPAPTARTRPAGGPCRSGTAATVSATSSAPGHPPRPTITRSGPATRWSTIPGVRWSGAGP